MGELRALTEEKQYREFIQARDHALEEILAKYTRAINLTVEFLKQRALEVTAHMGVHGFSREHMQKNREDFERKLNPYFEMAIKQSVLLIERLRRTTYVLSYSGQAEAIARTTNQEKKYTIHPKDLEALDDRETPSGGNTLMRMELAYNRLKNDVIDAFQLSQVLESPIDEALERIERAFPRSKKVKSAGKVMAKMAEAEKPEKTPSLSFGVIPSEDWEAMLQDYRAEALPGEDYRRATYDKVFYAEIGEKGDVTTYTRYEWEVENEVTQDFVQSVRDGEIDSAKASGIDEFQWIAVIDSHTDECCEWRDGLTTQEIKDGLDGEHSDDECDGDVPPIHFNCRCRLAPMTDEIPEEQKADFESFHDWLDQRGREAA